LYRIWQEAGKIDPKLPALENQEEKEEKEEDEEKEKEKEKEEEEEEEDEEKEEEEDPFFELFGYLCQDVHAISQHLKIIAELLPRKDGVEEKEASFLETIESIENNCNVAVRAANAATAFFNLLVQAATVFGAGFLLLQAVKKFRSQSE